MTKKRSASDTARNGEHRSKAKAAQPTRKPARRASKAPDRNGDAPKHQGGSVPAMTYGRVASEVKVPEVKWLAQPWFLLSSLTLITGEPDAGKSTLLAWLSHKAGRVVYFPEPGELLEMLLPRLTANGVDLANVKLMDDRLYFLLRDAKRITDVVKEWNARLVVFDPIDSFMDAGLDEIRGQDVRALLEAATKIGEQTGAAVVGVRHPGRDPKNINPGSRCWKSVPRSVVEVSTDGSEPPKWRMLKHRRGSRGKDSAPRYFSLDGEDSKPKRFVLGEQAERGVIDLAAQEDGPTGRYKVIEAAKLIAWMFEKSKQPTVEDCVKECRKKGIGDKARYEAMRLTSVESGQEDFGGEWFLYCTEPEWPAWLLNRGVKPRLP